MVAVTSNRMAGYALGLMLLHVSLASAQNSSTNIPTMSPADGVGGSLSDVPTTVPSMIGSNLIGTSPPSDMASDGPTTSFIYPSWQPTTTAPPTASVMPSNQPTTTYFPTVFPTVTPDCYKSLRLLQSKMEKQDQFGSYTYMLCPDTLFEIGFPNGFGVCCEGGDQPIIPRSNTVIMCGQDGSSANNCTLVGGQYQVFSLDIVYNEQTVNFLMKGITFQSGGAVGLLYSNSGDITCVDCIVKEQENLGPVYVTWQPIPISQGRRRRRRLEAMDLLHNLPFDERLGLAMNEMTAHLLGQDSIFSYLGKPGTAEALSDNDWDRNLQDDGPPDYSQPRQKIYFNQTLFVGNRQGPILEAGQFAIIGTSSGYNDIWIDECIFQNNTYTRQPKGAAMDIKSGSTFFISNSCLLENHFVGPGPVTMTGDYKYGRSNVYGTQDDGVTCQFIAALPAADEDPICLDYDASSCPVTDGGMPSTLQPAGQPTTTPPRPPSSPTSPGSPTMAPSPALGSSAAMSWQRHVVRAMTIAMGVLLMS